MWISNETHDKLLAACAVNGTFHNELQALRNAVQANHVRQDVAQLRDEFGRMLVVLDKMFDRLTANSEQIRLGFEASTSQQNAAAARAENLRALLLDVEQGQSELAERLGALESKWELLAGVGDLKGMELRLGAYIRGLSGKNKAKKAARKRSK